MKVFGQYCFRILFCCGYFFFKERFNYIFEKREREILIVSPLLHYPIYCSRLGRSQELSWSPNWVAGNQILSRVICGELDQREGSQNFNLCFCLGCQHVKQLMNLMCHNANACHQYQHSFLSLFLLSHGLVVSIAFKFLQVVNGDSRGIS